ncbi:MAG: hypothetical protein AA931_11685 [Peptococcaceae bacterium 1109]|nr:MAG: hypothetical protein AA931_11685 [Peptococcaceae bacterium 1109]
MAYKKKLIEVALPLDDINEESAREKSIRHGHPSTLHLWWARRPLAAARAVIWASLVDDPSSHPDRYPTEEAQRMERERLFGILTELIRWENSNNEDVLEKAEAEIRLSTGGKPPALLDPFAGGGAIPLEAQRLGLEAHASDLNPVAVMINKAMIEIPPLFAGQPPVNPASREKLLDAWRGALGLAEDVRHYGNWMLKEALSRIGNLYPTVTDEHGQELTVIAWIWARTVTCPNPACGCEMPLVRSFQLSKARGKGAYVQPIIDNGEITYEVRQGQGAPDGTVNRRGAKCLSCGTPVGFPYIREEGRQGRMGHRLIAIVADGNPGRVYLSPHEAHVQAAAVDQPEDYPDAAIPFNPRDFKTPNYGLDRFSHLFTARQMTALVTLARLVKEAQAMATAHALAAGMADDGIPLADGGTGAKAYGQAIGVYLAFAVDKMTNYHCNLASWHSSRELLQCTFARQALPMVWDFAEGNPLSNSSGCFANMLEWVAKCIEAFPAAAQGRAIQCDAQSDLGLKGIMVSTDPPYYDNIGYADLSDFFYIWMRESLHGTYPDLFRTMLTPKTEELVATPYRFDGDANKARDFFEDGMLKAFLQIHSYVDEAFPMTVYYAYRQSEIDEEAGNEEAATASTGWETMLSAILEAGFAITGTWPIRTEMGSRALARSGTNALASSVVLVCRKRPEDAPICTRRDFLNALKRELKPALDTLQSANIAPVDLAQSAIGPGMAVFSRYSKVLEADGTPMTIRTALQIINQELDLYFSEQDSELDADSRFCVDLYTQYAFGELSFGEADVLARAKNTSVDRLAKNGIVNAEKGKVRLLTREEIPEKVDWKSTWLLTQQLTRAMEREGVAGAAKLAAGAVSSEPERARALAYRLYTIAERKGWTGEAYAYNSLVTMWRDIQAAAAELRSRAPEQTMLEF